MQLETAQSIAFKNVTEEQLDEAFRDDARRGEYIILSQQPQKYLQAAGEGDGSYTLEYRDGDEDRHFYAAGDHSKEDVQRAFRSYLAGDSGWRTEFNWQKLKRQRTDSDANRPSRAKRVASSKPSLIGGLFLCLWGTLAFVFSIGITLHQQFMLGSRRGGNKPRTLITPETHPVFFWACVVLFLAVGAVVFTLGVRMVRKFVRHKRGIK